MDPAAGAWLPAGPVHLTALRGRIPPDAPGLRLATQRALALIATRYRGIA